MTAASAQADPNGTPNPMRCGAKTRKNTPCTRQAGYGTEHLGTGRCRWHGGASPQAQLSGVVELARREMRTMGHPLDIEPHDAILQCIRIAAGEVRYCSDRIADLEDAQAVAPVVSTMERDKTGGEDWGRTVEERKGPPALNVWVLARHAAMDRLVTYSATAIKAGVEERRVRLAERAGEMMAELIRGVLSELGVPLQDPRTREVVVRHLRLIEAGQAS